MRRDPDSVLGFITGPSVSFWFMHSVLNLFKNDVNNRFNADWLLVLGPYIHANRNQMQDQFLDLGRDWLLSVDNDIVFTPGDVQALYDVADERGPGVYSGAYVLENGFMVCGVWDDDEPMVYHNLIQLPAEPTEIGVVGAGFTLIHRDVFQAIGPGAFWPLEGNRGEDLSFSWRAREVGYTPVLVPKCNVGHSKNIVMFPHEQMRNLIGEDINLVELDDELKAINQAAMEEVKA
jgi:hypothetical protein